MIVKLVSILTFLMFNVIDLSAQHHQIEGKSYKALIGETCKEMTGGGCMIYKYQILNFSQDSVVVSYQVIANCLPKERENSYNHMYDDLTKKYKWSSNNNTITIENFDAYGKLTLQNSKLSREDNLAKRHIEFNEEHE